MNIPALDFTSLEQNAQVMTQYSGIEARLVKAWRSENKFSFKVGASWRQDSTITAIFADKNGEKRLFNDTSYINHAKFGETDLYSTIGYGRDFGKWHIHSTINFHSLFTHLQDKLVQQNSYERNWLYANPRLRVKWAISNRNSLSATYNYRARFADLGDNLGGYIFTNYRNLTRNIVTPYRINGHSINALYRFENSLKKVDGNISILYFKDGNARNNRYVFTPFYNLTERLNSFRDNETVMLSGEVIKFFPVINLSVKVQTQHTYNRFYNSIDNSTIAPNSNLYSRYLTQFVSTYSGIFNYISGVAWSVNQQKTQTNSIDVNPKFTQLQTWLKTTWKINKKLFMTVNNDYNVFSSPQNKSQNAVFTDITGQYEVKPSKIYIYLDIYNLFDVKQFSFNQLNTNQISMQNYRLLPRIGILKVEFRF